MDIETTIKYIQNVERRITPAQIATVYQGAQSLLKLPIFIQKKIIQMNSQRQTYMGFVVEPYSTFFAYEINPEMVKGYLPDNYELIPVSLFEDSEKKTLAIVGCFNVRTSVFSGTRFELYIIGRNRQTGLVSWLICDYESNTINYDEEKGFLSPTLSECIYTTSYNADIICKAKSKRTKTAIDFILDIKDFNCIELNKKLWIEGNLSIDYSGVLDNGGNAPFGLIFDPNEMRCAQIIRKNSIKIKEMEFGFISSAMQPYEVCCFQYAQHYLTTMFQSGHEMKDEDDLIKKIHEIVK